MILREEHNRYTILLHRYLEMKYVTKSEASQCFNQLMNNVVEMSTLVQDVKNFFKSYGPQLQSSPLFAHIFDLHPEENNHAVQSHLSNSIFTTSNTDNYTDLSDLTFLDMF